MRFENDLAIRKTKYFVGPFRYLDEWQNIGSYRRLFTYSLNRDNDPEAREDTATCIILDGDLCLLDKNIIEALDSEFTSHGCACEHDCCGCRSYDCTEIHRLNDAGHWVVVVVSSRNY